jgi:hypothetical protein
MGLVDRLQVNLFEVVSRPCTEDRILLPHPTVHTKHKLSIVKTHVKRTINKLENHAHNLFIVDLLFLHSSCFSMSFQVLFQRNRTNSNKDAWKI